MKTLKSHKPAWMYTAIVMAAVAITAMPSSADEMQTGRQWSRAKLRAAQPWPQMVAERQAAFQKDPTDFRFMRAEKKLSQALTSVESVISANETDPMDGVLIEWECSSDGNADFWDFMWMAIVGETVRAGATPYVYLVSWMGHDDVTTLAACSEMLENYEEVSADEVEWIQGVPSDAFWMKDYGPLFVRDIFTRDLSIEDAQYYPGRPNDDAIPVDFAARVDVPVSDFPLYFEGGNFLPNGDGLCITSSVLVDANPEYSEKEIRDLFRTELGCTELVIVQALDDWATGHVDMWLAWVDRNTLMVGEYKKNQDPVNRAIIEANIAEHLSDLFNPATGDAIQLVRMPMPSNCPPKWDFWLHLYGSNASDQGWAAFLEALGNGNNGYYNDPLAVHGSAPTACPSIPRWGRVWRTYLNVLFVNGTVVVPVYRQHERYEQEALEIWRSLGFNVRPVLADMIAPLGGEIHCVTQTMSSP